MMNYIRQCLNLRPEFCLHHTFHISKNHKQVTFGLMFADEQTRQKNSMFVKKLVLDQERMCNFPDVEIQTVSCFQ